MRHPAFSVIRWQSQLRIRIIRLMRIVSEQRVFQRINDFWLCQLSTVVVASESLRREGRLARKEEKMSQNNNPEPTDEMCDEYDFSGGVRGKFYQEYMKGTNVVLLDADVAEVLRNSGAVNQALRTLITVAENQLPQSR